MRLSDELVGLKKLINDLSEQTGSSSEQISLPEDVQNSVKTIDAFLRESYDGSEFCDNESIRECRDNEATKERANLVVARRAEFWGKADCIAVITAGGGALGGAIAQIPGGISGAILAAVYGCYISFSKKATSR